MAEIKAGKMSYDETLEKTISEYLPFYQRSEGRLRASKQGSAIRTYISTGGVIADEQQDVDSEAFRGTICTHP